MSALTTSGEHPVNWFDTALEIRADLEQVAIMVESVAGHNSGHAQHEPTPTLIRGSERGFIVHLDFQCNQPFDVQGTAGNTHADIVSVSVHGY